MLPNPLPIALIYGVAALVTLIGVVKLNWYRITSNSPTLLKREDDAAGQWKPSSLRTSSAKQFQTLVLESSKDIRKIGFIAVAWYFWLIWY